MTKIRDCPECEQGKHRTCIEEVLGDDDPPGQINFIPCPCWEREHTTLAKFVGVDESEDDW